MIRKLKAVPTIIAAAGLAAGIMAAVPPQTTQDYADGNRLVINGNRVFISGMNIAWNRFANDVGDQNVDINAFNSYFSQIKAAGGNAVRWWLHTDGQNDPKFNSNNNGQVTGLGSKTISNVQQVLDAAYNQGVVVSLCLFSFDLLQNDNNKSADQMSRNKKFLTEPANLDTYIQNALRPMLDAVGSHPAIMCWEVFNEPEGMATTGWATEKIDHSHILRFTNKIAGEVHRSTKKMASTGIHNFLQYTDKYSDAKLKAAGGDNDGYLDFYMAHSYPEYENNNGPFYKTAASWGFDRPVLIGEFPAQSWGPGTGYPYGTAPGGGVYNIVAAYEWAYNNGYCGAMSWSFTEGNKTKFGTYETLKPALQNLYTKYRANIEIEAGGVIPPPLTGDLAMKLAFTAQPAGDANESLLKKEISGNLQGKANLTFEIYIDPNSGSSLQMYPALQSGDADNWGWYTTAAINLGSRPKGQWITVTVPVSDLKKDGTGASIGTSVNLASVFFKFVASGSPFTGVIYIDNVKLGNDVISDFNEQYSVWSVAAGDVEVSPDKRPGTSSVFDGGRAAAVSASRAPAVTVRGKVLNVTGAANSETRVKLVDMRGKTVASFRAFGSGRFSLANIPAGRYLAETATAGKKAGSTAVMVR